MIQDMKKQETVRMLTTKEVAERLNADPGTVRMWCINKTLPNARQEETPRGPVWLIPETDLDGFERRGRGRPPKPTSDKKEDQPAEATVEEEAPPTKSRKAAKKSRNTGKPKDH